MMVYIYLLLLCASLCSAVPTNILWPCKLSDYKCIGYILSRSSGCSPAVRGKLDGEFIVPTYRFEAPYFNTTYIEKDLAVRNQDKCFVADFHLNTLTDKALLVIDCPDAEFEADRTLINHHSFLEDSEYSYHVCATYPLIRMTLTLDFANKLDLCSTYVFTDVTEMPRFRVDPKDLKTKNYLSKDDSWQQIFERENFFFRGYAIARLFIDANLCYYGCPITIL